MLLLQVQVYHGVAAYAGVPSHIPMPLLCWDWQLRRAGVVSTLNCTTLMKQITRGTCIWSGFFVLAGTHGSYHLTAGNPNIRNL